MGCERMKYRRTLWVYGGNWSQTADALGDTLLLPVCGGIETSGCVCEGGVLAFDALMPRPYDDTDAPPVRSDMRPMIDALTGCQYLKAGSALTPRLGADGRQLCQELP